MSVCPIIHTRVSLIGTRKDPCFCLVACMHRLCTKLSLSSLTAKGVEGHEDCKIQQPRMSNVFSMGVRHSIIIWSPSTPPSPQDTYTHTQVLSHTSTAGAQTHRAWDTDIQRQHHQLLCDWCAPPTHPCHRRGNIMKRGKGEKNLICSPLGTPTNVGRWACPAAVGVPPGRVQTRSARSWPSTGWQNCPQKPHPTDCDP